ncbi:DUF1212-domain-containing protein [Metschnikowia bicuspidata var. bicuspidata NRRL YB-4993]|uniref:DUF1212-domain-containing protein n=1 Tax=Metschnikowia bicuspidata var. bicuspidata NRRL YB-4993 TaxID=869754 RepID=A0A1A0H851_9ASCO|nr:DUF1212-domain-containing protein [Metschnikowia bicuspidata var. bicuspidata NRRL YB-4993]OBA20165.1 DUF1212-domain-containing protein [Metschnikowia bicuspidata var. bicuspidata NRRL YB-4993]
MVDNNSSSSDEELNYQSNFNVPSVNLAHLRKKDNKINAKSNLAKAKKKFTPGQKNVHFPKKNAMGDSELDTSTPNFSSERVDADSDLDTSVRETPVEGSASLPNFRFELPVGNDGSLSDDNSDDSNESETGELVNPVTEYNDDSSDEDIKDAHPGAEMDITDIRHLRSSQSSRTSSEKKNALSGIFRRMSLAEQVGDSSAPSRSDTFLGKVMNFAGGGSLNGGGLTPGANVQIEEPLDAEKEVGMDPNQPVEMKNLDFSALGEEAQNLIYAHAPDLKRDRETRSDYSDYDLRTDSTAHLIENEKPAGRSSHDNDQPREGSSGAFYQPNTDLFQDDFEDEFNDDDYFQNDGYVAPPKQVHAGVLSSLLKLYQNSGDNRSSSTLGTSIGGNLADEQFIPGEGTKPGHRNELAHMKNMMKLGPRKLAGKFHGNKNKATATPEAYSSEEEEKEKLDGDAAKLPSFQNARPRAPKIHKPDPRKMGKKLKRKDQKLKITVHIADILQRQRFIIRMCRALMMFGAPTHRLEEYMVMTSRVLEIDGQFVYFPGTMIVAFGDAATRTSEVHLVRCAQGLNLSKLSDTHKIYKDVIHDLAGVEEAGAKLEELLKSKNLYSPWVCVFLFGLGSACVCTWGFDGGWYDFPIAFGIGSIVGYLQFFMSSKSHLYSSVFEVTSSIVVSFIARGIGSIKSGKYFCFGAIAQGSLALILPGYIILCGSLELQSKNLVAGSVRMFYAIIYSLFLGFGITLGAALYGWVDSKATNAATCETGHGLDDRWRILMVPLFSICLGLINQARWDQLPVQTLITAISYIGTYYSGKHFVNVTEFTAAIGAFIIGILGNMYSRVGKGMAVSAMLPAIFVQVPSGIASQSTLLAGVETANKITNSSSSSSDSSDLSSLSFGAIMVEVSIGISVGLFAAALVVYPFGKRRSGLFSL